MVYLLSLPTPMSSAENSNQYPSQKAHTQNHPQQFHAKRFGVCFWLSSASLVGSRYPNVLWNYSFRRSKGWIRQLRVECLGFETNNCLLQNFENPTTPHRRISPCSIDEILHDLLLLLLLFSALYLSFHAGKSGMVCLSMDEKPEFGLNCCYKYE